MSYEAILLLCLIAVAGVLFITQWVSIVITSIGIIVSLALTGILEPKDALSGFSSPATITVISMLVLSSGLERAGIVDYAARLLSGGTRSGLRPLLLVLAIPTIGFSAFMNNTPLVALMIPVAITLSRRAKLAPSKILLPLSYFSILGGTCTLFGTSTNILVDALYREQGGPGFTFFEFAPLGLVFVAVGLIYILTFATRLLPDRTALADLLAIQAPGRFITEVVLKPGSRYIGKTLGQTLPEDRDVSTLQVVRGEEAFLKPKPDLTLQDGDVLYVESTAKNLRVLFKDPELEPGTAVADAERVPIFSGSVEESSGKSKGPEIDSPKPSVPTEKVSPVDLRIAEAVVTPSSRFVDRPVRSLGLSRKHGVNVLALRRQGKQHQYQLRDLRLSAGDVLLVQGEPQSLRVVHDEGDFLLIEGVEKTLTFPEKAPLAAGILMAVVVCASLGLAPIVFLALAGIAAMIGTRCIDARAAMRRHRPQRTAAPGGHHSARHGLAKGGPGGEGRPWTGRTGRRGESMVVGGHPIPADQLPDRAVLQQRDSGFAGPHRHGDRSSTGRGPQAPSDRHRLWCQC